MRRAFRFVRTSGRVQARLDTTQELGFPLSACYRDYVARIEARPAVREAERREALSEASSSQL
ncbi:hypothetical protein GHK56_10050 [Sinorhizobium meliloti]|nr:hypothetical protein [Sinorhizobium meliloti]